MTRAKIDLFPEYIRVLPAEQARALGRGRRGAVLARGVRRDGAQACTGAGSARSGRTMPDVGLYPMPTLTRDGPGYTINIHSDHAVEGHHRPVLSAARHVDDAHRHGLPCGAADGAGRRSRRRSFAPNTGYAFAVDRDTHHSVDTVGPEVKTRDSILLTYYVDAGPLGFLRNRGKRVGNFLLNELRSVLRRAAAQRLKLP